jgi:PAS domain S-box-containing protein
MNYPIDPKLLETIFSVSNEPIMITDAKSNGDMPDILYCNQAFLDMTGYSYEEIIGQRPSILAGRDSSLEDLILLGEFIKEERSGKFEILNYKKDGSTFWNRFEITPIKNEQSICTHWVAFERDVTENHTYHQKLLESEFKFKSLVQNSAIGIYIINDKKKFEFTNQKFRDIFEYDEIETKNLSMEDFIVKEDIEKARKLVDDRISGKILETQYDLNIFTKSGQLKTIETHGSRTIFNGKPAIIGTLTDITERKKSNEKIRKYSEAIEQSDASVVITDLNGNIEYVNPAFCKITGYTPEEAIGQNSRILKTDYNEKQSHENLWRNLNNNLPWRGIFCNKKKNGDLYWEQAVLSPIFNEQGIKTNYVAVKEDISARVQLENEKEKLIEELTASLKDLKQFTYITSHNLRAPITNLIGIIELLDMDLIEDKTTLLLLEGFKKSTLKLNETLQDLIQTLIIKEDTKSEKTLVNFDSIFEQVSNSIQNLLEEEKATIQIDFSKAPEAMLIKPYIESIFLNLITNSIKYSRRGIPALIQIHSYKEEAKLIIEFKDNGLGMDLEKIKDRLFGLYQKFHTNKDSKGIGLYLVKSHVKVMNGSIEAYSKPNEGTIFKIIFNQ